MAAASPAPAGVTVYGSALSPGVSRVLACLHEKDVPYRLAPVDMSKAEQKSPSFLALQPFGQIPAFQDGSTVVFESRAICRYVSNKYAASGNQALLNAGAGAGADALAAVDQWMEAESQSFNPPSLSLLVELIVAPMRGRSTDEATVEKDLKKLEAVLDVYNRRLGESRFLAGEEFSLADLVHLPNLHALVGPAGKAGLVNERENLRRWWEAASARPSWKKVVELQNASRV